MSILYLLGFKQVNEYDDECNEDYVHANDEETWFIVWDFKFWEYPNGISHPALPDHDDIWLIFKVQFLQYFIVSFSLDLIN